MADNHCSTRAIAAWAGASLLAICALSASAQTGSGSKPTFEKDGTVRAPAFTLPPSIFMSEEARQQLRARAGQPSFEMPTNIDITSMRKGMEMFLSPQVAAMQAKYPADIVETTIAGVPARIVTAKGGRTDPKHVLINLHGGGFTMCADACAILESLPIASVGGYKVISVNYRQGPEARFPAATEDVTAVYKELLKRYKPSQIGIYGCSAGGALSAQVAAWLPKKGLPQPGAIGIFGSGATLFAPGDSGYVASAIDGSFPPPPPPGTPPSGLGSDYFKGADIDGPMVSPAKHIDVLAKFPPTLVVTGSRAPDLSPAIYTHSQLVKAGVDGDLIVGEGLGHCYIYSANLPEAQDAYVAIAKFFQKHLK